MYYNGRPIHRAKEVTSYKFAPNCMIRATELDGETYVFAKDVCEALGYASNRLTPARKLVDLANIEYFLIRNPKCGCCHVSALNAKGLAEFFSHCCSPNTQKCIRFIEEHIMKKKCPMPTPKPDTSECPLFLTEKCTMECMKEHADKRAEKNCVEKNCVEQQTGVEPSVRAEPPVYTAGAVAHHKAICTELSDLYARKNNDYGDAFHLSFIEEGMAMARIRLGDKLNRFKTLTKDPNSQNVKDESVRDTLIDLANYAIMTVMEMDRAE